MLWEMLCRCCVAGDVDGGSMMSSEVEIVALLLWFVSSWKLMIVRKFQSRGLC